MKEEASKQNRIIRDTSCFVSCLLLATCVTALPMLSYIKDKSIVLGQIPIKNTCFLLTFAT